MRFRIKLTKFSLVVLILVSLILFFFYLKLSSQPVNYLYFQGKKFVFRADVRDAEKIRILPGEKEFQDIFFNPGIKGVKIVFVNSSDNAIVAVEGSEIAYKLKYAYLMAKMDVDIIPQAVESYEGIRGSKETPVIALVPPVFSNETLVLLKDNVAFVKAKSYRDFDLATIKLIRSILGI